jgi:hypothetical protein
VQCITHFLRLPIEDDFLDQLEDSENGAALPPEATAGGEDDGPSGGPPPHQAPPMKIPFVNERNAVMSQVGSHTIYARLRIRCILELSRQVTAQNNMCQYRGQRYGGQRAAFRIAYSPCLQLAVWCHSYFMPTWWWLGGQQFLEIPCMSKGSKDQPENLPGVLHS